MVVHHERLDWVGNFNWLLQQDLKEFFCYRQHDDTTAPQTFSKRLLQVADKEPELLPSIATVSTLADAMTRIVPSIRGEPLERMFQYIARLPYHRGTSADQRFGTDGSNSTSWSSEVRRISCSLAGVRLACQPLALGRILSRCRTPLL